MVTMQCKTTHTIKYIRTDCFPTPFAQLTQSVVHLGSCSLPNCLVFSEFYAFHALFNCTG